MAHPASIAIKRSLATTRILQASNSLAKELGVEALSLPLTGRDMNFLHAQQLEAIADYLETLTNALTVAPEERTNANGTSNAHKRLAGKAVSR